MSKMKPVKYIVQERSLIGNDVYEEGAEVEYDGLPAENLQPTCDEGRARYQQYLTSNAERIAKMQAAYSEVQAEGIATAVAKAVSSAIANVLPKSRKSELA